MAALTETQANRVWEERVQAEVRSLYFADLAARYGTQKQVITGVSFFLSSGAAATVIARLPLFVPTALALIAAIATAYSMAINLDRRVGSLVKLHCQWNHLCMDYDALWNHWYEDDAEAVMSELGKRAREASELATEMPYDERGIHKWEDMVFSRQVTTE